MSIPSIPNINSYQFPVDLDRNSSIPPINTEFVDANDGVETLMYRDYLGRVANAETEHTAQMLVYNEKLLEAQTHATDASLKIDDVKKERNKLITALILTVLADIVCAVAITFVFSASVMTLVTSGLVFVILIGCTVLLGINAAAKYRKCNQLEDVIAAPSLIPVPQKANHHYYPEHDMDLKKTRRAVQLEVAQMNLQKIAAKYAPATISQYALLGDVQPGQTNPPELYSRSFSLIAEYKRISELRDQAFGYLQGQKRQLDAQLSQWHQMNESGFNQQESSLNTSAFFNDVHYYHNDRSRNRPYRVLNNISHVVTSVSINSQRDQMNMSRGAHRQSYNVLSGTIATWYQQSLLRLETAYQATVDQLETRFQQIRSSP